MYVYKITNKINNKNYIGITQNIEERFNYHKTRCFQPAHKEYDKPLYKAFRKYGIDNFSFDVLDKDLLLNDAKQKEQEYIKQYDSLTHGNGYNITMGGDYTSVFGEEHHNAILTEKEALDIHQRRLKGENRNEVYKLYSDKISFGGFLNVWQLRTWKHLDPDFVHRNKDTNGVNNPNSIFTEEQVVDIRTKRKQGKKRIDVLKEYSTICSEATFNRIWYNKTYINIIV